MFAVIRNGTLLFAVNNEKDARDYASWAANNSNNEELFDVFPIG